MNERGDTQEEARPTLQDLLFVGLGGYVAAVRQDDGRLVWKRSLPGTGFTVVSLVFDGGRLFCASRGKVFALDPRSGEVLWENPLRGLGRGHVVLTTQNSNEAERVVQLLEQQLEDERARRTAPGRRP